MVNAAGGASYQVSLQQAPPAPVQPEPRNGENRVEPRKAPSGDSQRPDQRAFASRDEDDTRRADDGRRGSNLDVSV